MKKLTPQERAKHFDKMPAPVESQCSTCPYDDCEDNPEYKNPFEDPEHNELLDEKLNQERQDN